MKYIKLTIFFALCFILIAPSAEAAGDISVSPVIIDESGYARDIIDRTITVTNNASYRTTLYINVNDIDPREGAQEFERYYGSDQAESLANWTQIQRSVELMPGETKQLPLTFHVNLSAKPGTYHAFVSFYQGSTRTQAEERPPIAQATLNFEVKENIKEFMQVLSFRPKKVFFTGLPAEFEYELENTGNQNLEPKGEIIIYNRRGREVDAFAVNAEGSVIPPDSKTAFESAWQDSSQNGGSMLASISSGAANYGKYKAILRVEYGASQKAIQDTVYFWVIPVHLIAGLFVAMAGFVIFIVRRAHKRA